MYHGFASAHVSSSARLQLPEFPNEEPSAKERSDYFEAAQPLILSQYAADMSGETPSHLLQLTERNDLSDLSLLPGDEAASAQGQKHNHMINKLISQNAARDLQLNAAMRERSNDLS